MPALPWQMIEEGIKRLWEGVSCNGFVAWDQRSHQKIVFPQQGPENTSFSKAIRKAPESIKV